jgi:hypothetical protein
MTMTDTCWIVIAYLPSSFVETGDSRIILHVKYASKAEFNAFLKSLQV